MPKKTKAIKKTDRKKAWLRKVKPSLYEIETKEVNKTILIVSEGQTEKLYFESFPVLTLTVKAIDLGGQSKQRLIGATESIIKNNGQYDEVWCVFDMDANGGEKEYSDFDNSILSGMKKGYNVAYSNDSFELWFYLHYDFTDQRNHRDFYYKALSKYWNINYEKDGKSYAFCSKTYFILKEDEEACQKDAVERAKSLYAQQKHLPYHKQNPVTKVYELVELLNNNCRK